MEMATRQPKKKFNLVGFLIKTVLPLAAIAAFVGALNFGPSKRLILEGPLKPYLAIAGSYWDQFAKPLHFIAQQQVITEKNREIQALNSQIDKDRKDLSSRDDKIKSLQNQVAGARAAAAQANATPGASGTAAPAAVAANQAAAGGAVGAAGAPAAAGAAPGASAAPSADDVAIKRTADVWSQMDADAVAALVPKLPMDYVIRVLGQMSADQVAEVLGALPPKVAAQLTLARVAK